MCNMKKINSRDELNHYYRLVQDNLDRYMKDYKVNPEELHNYVKNNMFMVIEESGLADVDGAYRIVLDVVEHLYNSNKDTVMTFESFVKFM